MHRPPQREPLAQRWRLLEEAVERLHRAARQSTTAAEFYTRLLREAAEILDVEDLSAWTPCDDGRWHTVAEQGTAPRLPADVSRRAAATLAPTTIAAADRVALVYPIRAIALDAASKPTAAAIVCIGGVADPEDGARQLLDTFAEVAADFHALDRLRSYEHRERLGGEAVAVLRRICLATDAQQAMRVLANDGRLVVGCDRLSVLVGYGRKWRLWATSGVDRVERQTDFRRDVEALALYAATWGEPFELGDHDAGQSGEDLPPSLSKAAALHLDHSHPRRLCCVPFRLPGDRKESVGSSELVLLGEDFAVERSEPMQGRLIELGETCAGAIATKLRYERPLARLGLWCSERTASLASPGRLGRLLGATALVVILVLSLTMIPVTHEIEAPATLLPVDRQHVFATTAGTVSEINVRHGDVVKAGDTLAVLEDPELALERQTIAGQLAAIRERLAAIRATRTQRSAREQDSENRLPLSAEAQQLAEQQRSLLAQRTLLKQRTEALVLRSPQDGQVLTRNVRSLLEARPVERGQQLFTIADVDGPWQLEAELSQRDVQAVLAAQQQTDAVAVRYRLAGEPGRDYRGVLEHVAAAAVLDAQQLAAPPRPVEATIRAEGPVSPAARSGMSATVRIDCGERSLGYVLLHDAWETVYRWLTF